MAGDKSSECSPNEVYATDDNNTGGVSCNWLSSGKVSAPQSSSISEAVLLTVWRLILLKSMTSRRAMIDVIDQTLMILNALMSSSSKRPLSMARQSRSQEYRHGWTTK